VGERTRITFSVSRRATVRVTVLASGTGVRTLLPDSELPGGRVSLTWDGRTDSGSPAGDRAYRVRVAATSGVEQSVVFANVLVDRTLGSLSVEPRRFSPNGDGRLESATAAFVLVRPAQVRVRMLKRGKAIRTVLSGQIAAGAHTATWDGRTSAGRADDGRYTALVEATTSLGTRALARYLVVDTTPPRARILSVRLVRGVTRIRLALSEPARLRIWYGRRAWYDGDSILVDRPAGEVSVWRRIDARAVRVLARDAVGIAGRPVLGRTR
jgi:flagellar hook assembly protein FlgD